VCATRARIDVFSPEGGLLRSWGQAGSGPGQFVEAFDVGVASDDTVFVAVALMHIVSALCVMLFIRRIEPVVPRTTAAT